MSHDGPGLIERGVTLLCHTVAWVSTTVIFLILAANTVLRYATGSSLQWGNEVPELLFPWLVMAGVVLAALPPVLVILLMQRLFVKGLVDQEK